MKCRRGLAGFLDSVDAQCVGIGELTFARHRWRISTLPARRADCQLAGPGRRREHDWLARLHAGPPRRHLSSSRKKSQRVQDEHREADPQRPVGVCKSLAVLVGAHDLGPQHGIFEACRAAQLPTAARRAVVISACCLVAALSIVPSANRTLPRSISCISGCVISTSMICGACCGRCRSGTPLAARRQLADEERVGLRHLRGLALVVDDERQVAGRGPLSDTPSVSRNAGTASRRRPFPRRCRCVRPAQCLVAWGHQQHSTPA